MKRPPNKKLANIADETWHSKMQDHILKLFESLDIEIKREHRIDFSGGHKNFRRADLFIPEDNLVIEIQKSNFGTKEFTERNEDYKLAGVDIMWLLNEERWQPDTNNNSELSKEPFDGFVRWRAYAEHLDAQHIYNSGRVAIIDYVLKNPSLNVLYCLTEREELSFRHITKVVKVARELTPKFPANKHYKKGTDFKNNNQPKEIFTVLSVDTDVLTLDSLPEVIYA